MLEGESLLNDATALVLLRTALIAAVAGTFSFGSAVGAFVWAVNLTVHQLPPSAPATDLVLAKRLASLLGADVLADHSGQYGEWALVCADGRAFIVQEQLGEEKEGFWIHEDPATWRPLIE